jgi:hypothetical protein
MGRVAIAAYKPRPGKQAELLAVVAKHWRVLASQQLVSDRPRYVMRARDGTVVEIFEWRSAEAIEKAHSNPAVEALWFEFEAACEYVPLASVAELQGLFSEFEPLQI